MGSPGGEIGQSEQPTTYRSNIERERVKCQHATYIDVHFGSQHSNGVDTFVSMEKTNHRHDVQKACLYGKRQKGGGGEGGLST